jgi:hypothetical protein
MMPKNPQFKLYVTSFFLKDEFHVAVLWAHDEKDARDEIRTAYQKSPTQFHAKICEEPLLFVRLAVGIIQPL